MKREPQSRRSQRAEAVLRSDEGIRSEIAARLRQAADLDTSNVTIDVQACMATLQGSVPDARTRYAVEVLVEACPGVQDIENRIDVRPP